MDTINETNLNDTHKATDDMAIPALMFCIGVVGNITAIAVLSRSKREHKESAFYTLVFGLAVTDLLGTCLASPVTIVNYLEHRLVSNNSLCEFHSFILLFFGVTELNIICAMSAERHLAVNHPYAYQRWSTDRHAACWCLFLIYLGNILFCSLPMLGFSRSILQQPHTWCFIDWSAKNNLHAVYSYLYAVVNSLFVILTVTCNLAVCVTLSTMHEKRKGRQIPRDGVKELCDVHSSAVETEMILVLIVTSLVVLVCSTPLVVCVFVNQINTVAWSNDINLLAIRFASVNPILDPWVYILLRRPVLYKVLRVWKELFKKRRNAIVGTGSTPVYGENLLH